MEVFNTVSKDTFRSVSCEEYVFIMSNCVFLEMEIEVLGRTVCPS